MTPKPLCAYCHSQNTSRFQWVDNAWFEYWICWTCMGVFTVDKPA